MNPRSLDEQTVTRLWVGVPVVASALVVANLVLDGKVTGTDYRSLDLVAYVLAAISILALGLARRRPRLALGMVAVALASYRVLDYPAHPGQFASGVALFLAFVYGARREAVVLSILAGAAVVFVAPQVLDDVTFASMGRTLPFFVPLVPVAAGYLVWTQQQNGIRERAQLEISHQARLAGMQRDSALQRVAIARDLHDTVGHGISVISIQSGAALSVLDTNPEVARESLLAINESCRTAMTETKQALATLRGRDGQRAPHIEATVMTAEATGLEVSFEHSGSLDDVAPRVADTVRRLAQESLTNTLKHAAADRIEITLTVSDRAVRFEFADVGQKAPAKKNPQALAGTGLGGQGLKGMAERVSQIGGSLHAAPTPAGFRVSAQIPISVSQ